MKGSNPGSMPLPLSLTVMRTLSAGPSIGDERDAFRLGSRARRVERGFEHRNEVCRPRLDPQLARDDTRRIEPVFDDLELRLRVALDDGNDVVDGFSVHRAGAQHSRVA